MVEVIINAMHVWLVTYILCSLRYPDTYTTTQDHALEVKTRCEVMIDDILKNSSFHPKKRGGSAAPAPKDKKKHFKKNNGKKPKHNTRQKE